MSLPSLLVGLIQYFQRKIHTISIIEPFGVKMMLKLNEINNVLEYVSLFPSGQFNLNAIPNEAKLIFSNQAK